MEAEEAIETVIEVIWWQTTPGTWVAVLQSPLAEEYHEVHTVEEFEQALLLLCQQDAQPATR